VAARVIRSTASATSSAPAPSTSRSVNRPVSPQRSPPTQHTTRCASHGRSPQRLRSAYVADNLAVGKRIAEQLLEALATCPIPELARLGKTLKRWSAPFLAYFTTGRANNGGTEAINGLIELHRRIARGFRNRHNYRLRMLLIGGGLTSPYLT
jgi:transposase